MVEQFQINITTFASQYRYAMSNKEKVFEMRTVGKMTYSQISKELGISKATVIYHSKRVGTTGLLNKLSEEQIKKNKYTRIKEYRIRQKEKAIEYKGGECQNCGYKKCIAALEFHHRDATKKEFVFSKYSNHNWEKIKLELDKCDMLCANCHREHHSQQIGT